MPGAGGAGGVGLIFHDRISAAGRSAGAGVRATSELLVAAARLRALIGVGNDPDLPPEFAAFLPSLDSAIQAGALSIIALGQGADGLFGERMAAPAGAGPNYPAQVSGMRALTVAYEAGQVLVVRLALQSAWSALETAYGAKFDAAVPPPPSEVWPLVALWQESQGKVRADIGDGVDWKKWEARVGRLRQ
jgi:hypothetical protein